jgi:outer membrane lipoprotein-sorting protein
VTRRSIAAALLALAPLSFSLRADTLEAVLARMDKQAAAFRKLTAKFKKITYTEVLNENSTEEGSLWLMRNGKDMQVRGEVTGQDAYSFGFRGRRGEKYNPKINTVQIFDLGKERGLIDQFLLLGFGSSAKDILKNYQAKIAGAGTVGGVRTAILELTPKDPKILEQVRKVDLWIPENAGYPVQQKFFQPGGNYYLISYANVQLKPALPDSAFQLQLPANVNKEYPQK